MHLKETLRFSLYDKSTEISVQLCLQNCSPNGPSSHPKPLLSGDESNLQIPLLEAIGLLELLEDVRALPQITPIIQTIMSLLVKGKNTRPPE